MLVRHMRDIWPGKPNPRGATYDGAGVNFSVYSRGATKVEICLYDPAAPERELERFELPEVHGFTWHGYVPGLEPGALYGLRVHGPFDPEAGHRFNPHKLLVDPYAKATWGEVDWRAPVLGYRPDDPRADLSFDDRDSAAGVPKSVVVSGFFDWGGDRRLDLPWRKTVIYELHVKGFTKLHPEVPESLRGTYAGLAHPKVIEHMKRLGVTAVELLPVHEAADDSFLQSKFLRNYWGYSTLNFFAPEQQYASRRYPGGQVNEFKAMVRALHAAGIEVLLDVVYNHTCEGNHLGPTLSLKGVDNASYYWLMPDSRYYLDFSGCGNTLNAALPEAARLIVDSLRYWVDEMHVDGFRFDLAASLGRVRKGEFDNHASLFQIITQDPVLSSVKLIAEPWDLGMGGYQVGAFPAPWREWNGKFRDGMRRYWKGDDNLASEIGYRLTGSPDLYQGERRRPQASINFITAHDGFTLHDLVTYGHKHNDANGEWNKDGADDNQSWNCGVEGETDDQVVVALRERQKRNLLASLFLSQGVPMLVAGDEMGRTQGGNNNAYCQDNEISWIDWNLDQRRQGLLDFTRRLIALKSDQPVLQRRRFLEGDFVWREGGRDLTWIRPDGREMNEGDWQQHYVRALGFELGGDAIPSKDEQGQRIVGDSLLVLMNAHHEPIKFKVPGKHWMLELDTGGERQASGQEVGEELELTERSLLVLRRPARVTAEVVKKTGRSLELAPPRRSTREAGVLVPLFSMRSRGNWGVGDISDVGRYARWASRAGFSVIQLLPINETTRMDASPYAACSAFAIDPVFLSLGGCEDFEALGGRAAMSDTHRHELESLSAEPAVSWQRVRALKSQAAHLAFEHFMREEWQKKSRRAGDLIRFRTEHREWLEDYALFKVLHERFGKAWTEWPAAFRDRNHSALANAREKHAAGILELAWQQWQIDRQWRLARTEAEAVGVGLMGDLPFIVAGDSADAWAHPQSFRLDLRVGTPPEGGDQGQDWGLPAYNWDELQKVEFAWIRRRAARARQLFSSYRVDHVLGFYRTYVRSSDGNSGFWPAHEPAQLALGETILRAMRTTGEVIAEDLGSVPPFLRPSLQRLGVPGYKVLRWEKDRDRFGDPGGWPQLSVAANATHDTETTADWYDALSGAERAAVAQVPGLQTLEGRQQFDDTVRDALLRVLYAAPSKLVVIPFQDAFGQRERINVPGTVAETNWAYRVPVPVETLTTDDASNNRLRALAEATDRRPEGGAGDGTSPGDAGRYRPVARTGVGGSRG
jgi:isoamylase